MTGQRQTVEIQRGRKQKPEVMPAGVERIGSIVRYPTGQLAEMNAPFRNGSAAGQAAQLASPGWQAAQRQALATRIGRVQGNGHLQCLVASLRVSTEPLATVATVPIQGKQIFPVATEPLEEEVTTARMEDVAPALAPTGCENAGGCVYCKGDKLTAWVNPSMPEVTKDCVKKHENKHVSDFEASDDYKDYCSKEANKDKAVYYKSTADQTKFELPAIDLEIKCLKEKLKTEKDENNKKILKNRIENTLPNYRKACGG